MKVIQYGHTSGGGHWRYVEELAKSLAAGLGVHSEVVIVSSVSAPESSVRVVRALTPLDYEARGRRWLWNRLRAYAQHGAEFRRAAAVEFDPSLGLNVCHFQELPNLRPFRVVRHAAGLGFRTVITVHNVTPHEPTFKQGLLQRARVRAWAEADLLIVHSPELGAQLESLLGRDRRPRVEVVPHPVWEASTSRPDESGKRAFLFFGHLRANKGISEFINALGRLGNPTSSIIGRGSSPMVESIRERLAQNGLSNCVLRAEFVDEEEIPAIFAQHDVLVAPYTHFSAQSGVTHLAIAYGLPLVVTDVGALAEPVREFGLGAIVQGPEELPEAMLRVLDEARGHGYRQRFQRAQSELSGASIARTLVRAYQGGGAPQP